MSDLRTAPSPCPLAQSQQFEQFVWANPALFPLRFTAKQALQEVSKINKLAIADFQPGDKAFLDLRFYDGRTSSWFDSLELPRSTPTLPVSVNLMYVTPIVFTRWLNAKRTDIEASVPFWGADSKIRLKAYDVQAYVCSQLTPRQIPIDQTNRKQYEHLLQA